MKNSLFSISKVFFLILILTSICSCRNSSKEPVQSPGLNDASIKGESEVRLIFFNMYLPTEMSRLFEKSGANYNPEFLNPADNLTGYTSPHLIAVNLGIFGVDMNYARFFNQTAVVAKYLNTINILAGKLGIPSDFYEDLISGMEKYYNDKDSVSKIASGIYTKTDKFLKSNNKESLAALIVMGSWIEAMYIASGIYEADNTNIEIMERIAEQKYSLNSLITLLSNYQDDITIAGYILMLKTLKRSFDQFQIFYSPDNLMIDTATKVISAKVHQSEISPEIIKEITHVVASIRNDLVN